LSLSKKWFIDIGHGGKDPGAINTYITEKSINLIVGLEVGRILQLNGQFVKYSRDTDISVDLNQRPIMANSWGADYFISVHHNAGGGDGLVIIHSVNGGPGKHLAEFITPIISEGTGQNIRGVYSKKGNNGDYYAVIKYTDMPAIIIEYGFLDNVEDYKLFDTKPELLTEAKYIAKGLLNFIGITDITYGEVNNIPQNVKKSKYFSDVPENHWAIENIDKAKEIGIIFGIGGGKLGFTEDMARIITWMLRVIEITNKTS